MQLAETKDPIERLREWVESAKPCSISLDAACKVNDFADEIETTYMRLPLDAGGVPIRPGQTLYRNGKKIPGSCVYGVDNVRVYIWDYYGDFAIAGLYADGFTHEKPGTVESVLAEIANDLGNLNTFIDESCIDSWVAIYAEKIRKAVSNG